jgi:hypothetical protein
MKRLKIGAVAVLAVAGLVALVPAGAFASSHSTVTTGTVAALNLDTHNNLVSFAVTTPAATSVTVGVNAKTKYIPMSAAAKTAGFVAGDAVWASGGVGKHQYASSVKYDVAPFAIPYAKRTFNGKYDATLSTPPTPIVIDVKGGKHLSFATTAATKYRLNGKKVAAQPTFKAGERMIVYGQEFTDGSWQAERIDAFKK